MLFENNGYRRLAKALAPLALDGRVHYLPNFECCRNCAAARVQSSDWGMARGIVTFNEQMKESADETGQLELTVLPGSVNGGDEGFRYMAVLLTNAWLFQAGYREVKEDDPIENGTFLQLDYDGFVIGGNFRGKAKVDSAVQKTYGYDLATKSPFGIEEA